MTRRAFAVAAHPDDIEFLMAGTLIRLAGAGYELHTMNIANGSCGTSHVPADEIVRIRRDEARAAAASIGAVYHESLVPDIEIYYEKPLLARVAAVMREVAPEILLTQSPDDYMEDHQNAARLAVTAAFVRGMNNFQADPPRDPVAGDVAVYHAQPHSNRGPLGEAVRPHLFVDATDVLDRKRAMLACHESQRRWLDESQGMDSYLAAMEAFSREAGAMSGRFEYAEGWRHRLHLGFGPEGWDPLADALGAAVCSG
ncbi:MAG: PIG-L family deacetylase [Planctomycetes bacterium]|nr:PIG-L family deacetylase [Planctomycetota bacterium]